MIFGAIMAYVIYGVNVLFYRVSADSTLSPFGAIGMDRWILFCRMYYVWWTEDSKISLGTRVVLCTL